MMALEGLKTASDSSNMVQKTDKNHAEHKIFGFGLHLDSKDLQDGLRFRICASYWVSYGRRCSNMLLKFRLHDL